MARIRTIKPEFPQSESMGRVSREARLLFIQLWTLCDDYGRGRGDSRMLASLLYPYDDDAGALIDGWMAELEKEGCVVRYKGTDGASYVASLNWDKHQKVDKPSKSKVPAPTDATIREATAKPREHSRTFAASPRTVVVGPRTKDQGRDQGPKDLYSASSEAGQIVSSPSSKASEPADFDAFWTLCPRKTGKKAAARAFASALKRASLSKLLTGMQRYAAERQGEEERFTKHPASWLNGDCWNDPPAGGRVASEGPKPNGNGEWSIEIDIDAPLSPADELLCKVFGGMALDVGIFRKRATGFWPAIHGTAAPDDPASKIDPVVLSRWGYAPREIFDAWKAKHVPG